MGLGFRNGVSPSGFLTLDQVAVLLIAHNHSDRPVLAIDDKYLIIYRGSMKKFTKTDLGFGGAYGFQILYTDSCHFDPYDPRQR
jgi:hypothetical protein